MAVEGMPGGGELDTVPSFPQQAISGFFHLCKEAADGVLHQAADGHWTDTAWNGSDDGRLTVALSFIVSAFL